LVGSGVSYCATCDGAFFGGKDVAVVGGGNTAAEDALFLSVRCRKVWLIHRRDRLRAEKRLLDLLAKKPNVELVLDTTVSALRGGDSLEGVTLSSRQTGQSRELELSGLFVAIGQAPATGSFSPPVALDSQGYIIAGEDCKTNIDGVFAAGDCRAKSVRQLVTAAADGAVAALAAVACLG
jgi:thioredoxin reductase (NADPH)